MPSPRTRSPHAIELLLRSTSRRLLNWDRYTVRQDMFDAGVAWTFTLWYSRKVDALWETVKREVRVGEEVVFSIDGAPQISGRIERATIKVSRKGGMSLTISGRDTAGPAIKWDADPRITLYNRALPDVGKELFAQLGINLALLDKLSREQIEAEIGDIVMELLVEADEALNARERKQLVGEVLDELLGLGPLEPLLKDEGITDILVNGHKTVFVERNGLLEKVPTQFQIGRASCRERV